MTSIGVEPEPAQEDDDQDVPRVRVIERSLDILEALSDGPRTLSEICRDTTLSKGTAFRLLAGLGHRRVIVKDPLSAKYMLGPGLLRLVSGAVSGLASIASLGRDALADLAARSGETVALHVQVGLERVCIQEVPSPQPIRFISSVGSSAALPVGAAGKVLLAYMDPAERQRLVPMLQGVGSLKEMKATLEEIAAQGWAISVSERVEGASAITVPVVSELPLMSLSVLGPTARLPRERLLEFLPLMQETAAGLAELLNNTRP
jgi:DNA-binding IclR family transcriptional regulator